MPLVLTLKEGQDFYVDDERFVVDRIDAGVAFTLRKDGNSATFEITDAHATEVLPDVFVSAGVTSSPMVCRVAIKAPMTVIVLRGDRKRNPRSED